MHKGTILIVDDEPDVLESTALVVRSLGYEAITLSDPSRVIGAIESERPDLVLQDLRMPDLNVSGLVAALRTNPATANIPIVFFSASADLPATAARYDAWGYLAKPFTPQQLSHLLRQVIGSAPARPGDAKDVQRQVRNVFHEYWNLLAALSNYVSVLERSRGLDAAGTRSVRGLDEVLLKLESKTDRLRAFVSTLVGPEEEPVPPRRAAN